MMLCLTPQSMSDTSSTRPDGRVLEVSLIDCGVKHNIMRELATYGVRTTVFPCTIRSAEVLERDPDGIAFSPGPGDPKHLGEIVRTARELIGSGKPVFGICLGNQIVGKAFGADTFKLPFGHPGGHPPQKDLGTGTGGDTTHTHSHRGR